MILHLVVLVNANYSLVTLISFSLNFNFSLKLAIYLKISFKTNLNDFNATFGIDLQFIIARKMFMVLILLHYLSLRTK